MTRLVNVNPQLFTADPVNVKRIQSDLDPSIVDSLDEEESIGSIIENRVSL